MLTLQLFITFSLGGVDRGEDVVPGPPGGDRDTLVPSNSLLILNTAGGRQAGGFYFTTNIFTAGALRYFGQRGGTVDIVLPEEGGGGVFVIKHARGRTSSDGVDSPAPAWRLQSAGIR